MSLKDVHGTNSKEELRTLIRDKDIWRGLSEVDRTLFRHNMYIYTTKLQKVLKKLHTDKKITTDLYHKMRNLHPRWPQLYRQPKIHKPGAPIRPVVSFYNTPLQALHKVLASFLKPLAQNPLRLKDSSDFKHRFDSSLNPSFHYHASLDVQSLYTSCDMRLVALKTVISSFEQNPSRLPLNVTTTTIGSLINFCLDNSYLEFNCSFYSQDEGETETTQNPSLHSLTPLAEDLNFTQEHPSTDGTIPFLDVLIHPDKSTSVYRKPTHTNLYTKYSSCTTNSSKNAVIRSLTRRAHNICSPQHLDDEFQTVRHVCLQNGFPPHRITTIMDEILGQHDIKVTHSSATSLRNLLTKTKTTPPTHLTPNTIYEISCSQCPSKYAGQTYRPLVHRMKEHERCYRLNNAIDESTDRIKSAPAHHALTTGHTISWNNIEVLKSLTSRSQLDLTEHAAIQIRQPAMNRTDRAPKCSSLWDPILPKIAKSLKSRPSGISFSTSTED
ncbi:uncharacterized protein LOC134821042 [Bolinopsis microptera]|uniref:uncharacterized protein LOC134821042 n=1 Tax=Bolinopsis microptera TaxID=2820187 RepID=UPI0030793476